MEMTEQEAVERIRQKARVGQKPGLERIRRLLGRLGDPQKKLRFIHVAGSNGKGSTAAMVAAVMADAGLRTGLYTSPHLRSIRERFRVNGGRISEEDFVKITTQVLEQAEDETEFELLTAIGMLYFVKAGCYVVVLETGLGGRLDPTNVIDAPEVAVITNIGLEHTEVLGDTLEKIAAEKAGIIKPGCDVVLYKQGQEVTNVVEQVCRTQGAALHIAEPAKALAAGLEGQTFTWRNSGPYWLFLPGEYQLRNAAVALETLRALACRGWCIPERSIEVGLSKMFFWCGRLDRVRRNPDVILDGGHNPQSMEALGQSLKGLYPGKKLIFLTGVLANKDYPAMMEELLPLAKEFFTVAPDSPRALPARELADCLESRGGRAVPCETLQEGLDRALAAAGTDDVVCVCGSLYMIGEAWDLLRRC